MKKRIIKLGWDKEGELVETNASNEQIRKVIDDLMKKMPDDYCTSDFIGGLISLGFTAKIVIIDEEFNF